MMALFAFQAASLPLHPIELLGDKAAALKPVAGFSGDASKLGSNRSASPAIAIVRRRKSERSARAESSGGAFNPSHRNNSVDDDETRALQMKGRGVGMCKVTRGSSSATAATRTEEEVNVEWEEAMAKMKRLQNGSDIRGVALAGESGREVNLAPAEAFYLGAAFGEWVLQKHGGRRVSLGRDPRVTGPSLLAAAAAGLKSVGCSVADMHIATTPACFMSTILPVNGRVAFDASVMLTASHLPYTRNGFKFFTSEGGLNVSDIESICNVAALNSVKFPARCLDAEKAGLETVNFMAVYSAHLRDVIRKGVNHPTHYHLPLQGFKVAVNAGNGSGGFFAHDVLQELGADTSASVNLEPDGMFPNHTPNPEDKKAMAVTRGAVMESKADLGVVFDTDVDRSGVVDSSGNVINGNRLIALMASIVLSEHPGSLIVTDARTSDGVSKFIAEIGGMHCLYRVGYRNVINKGIDLNEQFGAETHLMMETSGHGALKENYFLDDGAYMAVKIVIEMVRMRLRGSQEGIGGLIKDLEEPQDDVELRVGILSKPQDVKQRGAQLIESFRRFVVGGGAPGWRLSECGDCWVSDGCLADFDEGQSPKSSHSVDYEPPSGIDAHMYRAEIYDARSGASGWVHMRQSIHNPNFAINMQSSRPGGCHGFAKILLERFFLVNNNAYELDVLEVEKYVAKIPKEENNF